MSNWKDKVAVDEASRKLYESDFDFIDPRPLIKILESPYAVMALRTCYLFSNVASVFNSTNICRSPHHLFGGGAIKYGKTYCHVRGDCGAG